MDVFAPTHLLIILLIVLIIFGPSKLGDLGSSLGKAIRDFKRAMNEPEEQAKNQPSNASGATSTGAGSSKGSSGES